MAAVESDTTVPEPEEDQKEKMCPSEEDGLNETSAPNDFPELTPSQFGISIQSFTPTPYSKCKDKTRLAQIKARRRSTVGVRGSPETNSLIRFIAQQRMKTPTTPRTSELVRSSPFSPCVPSTLSQKMASFQNLMYVVESDACDAVPVQDGNTGGCIMTRDYLSDEISCCEGKENNAPTPTASKKRRLGPPEGCSVEITEVDTPSSLQEQENAFSRPVSDGPAAASPPPHVSPVSSVLEIKPSEEDDSIRTSAVKKKKQVRFGGPLSPEFFDKNLPPSTPLQKGGTPARAATPGGSLQLRSLLKTPQKSESNELEYQPELFSPTGFGASPTLVMLHKHRRVSDRGDGEDGKIVFPAMEEFDSAMTSDSECAPDVQPLNLNTDSQEASLSQVLTELDTEPSHSSQMDECKSVSEEDRSEAADKSPTPTRSSNRRRKTNQEPRSEPGARSCNRKRKQPEETEPVKRSKRSAAKSACGKMKKAFSASRRWDKEVDRSLYGSREYASKNPVLSPIRERLSFSILTPAALQTPASTQETLIIPDVANDTPANDFVVTKATENPLLDYFASPNPGKEDGRLLRSAGRRGQRRKVSVVSEESWDQPGGKMEQLFEEQSSSSLESSGTLLKPSEAPQIDVNTEELDAQIPAADTETEDHPSPHAPSAKTLRRTEPKQKRATRGRRSSTLQEPPNQPEEQQTSCDVEGNGLRERAESHHEDESSSDRQEEAWAARVHLAPWLADFNFDDVFKPAAIRRHSSVRRSLRNQQGDSAAGLAWLPHTSPDSIKEARRKTRQRRLSAALPVPPPLPEETQDPSLNEPRVTGDN